MVPRPRGFVEDFQTANVVLEEECEGAEVGMRSDATTTISCVTWSRRVMMRPAKLDA